MEELNINSEKIKINSIRDFPDDNESWFSRIMKKVEDIDIYYAGENEVTYSIFNKKGIKTHKIDRRIDDISATEIRKLKNEDKDFSKMVTEYVKKNI